MMAVTVLKDVVFITNMRISIHIAEHKSCFHTVWCKVYTITNNEYIICNKFFAKIKQDSNKDAKRFKRL
jgi:hypothetical protein